MDVQEINRFAWKRLYIAKRVIVLYGNPFLMNECLLISDYALGKKQILWLKPFQNTHKTPS
jgi:hypothetical protein